VPASYPSATKSAEPSDLGTALADGRSMDPECEDPASPYQRAIRRQISEVGAVCSNSARTDLCGGALVNRRSYRDKATIFSESFSQNCFRTNYESGFF
jgi:hypothetical protein